MTSEELIAELKKRGVELDVGSCGCCGGAGTKVKLDGVLVMDESQYDGKYATDLGELRFAK